MLVRALGFMFGLRRSGRDTSRPLREGAPLPRQLCYHYGTSVPIGLPETALILDGLRRSGPERRSSHQRLDGAPPHGRLSSSLS
ncbi:hypothetical protein MRX96_027362 [Rhipicephalus microplus]